MVKNRFFFYFYLLWRFFLVVDRFGSVENCRLLIIRREYFPKPVRINRNFAEIIRLLDHIYIRTNIHTSLKTLKMYSFWVVNSFYIVNCQNLKCYNFRPDENIGPSQEAVMPKNWFGNYLENKFYLQKRK